MLRLSSVDFPPEIKVISPLPAYFFGSSLLISYSKDPDPLHCVILPKSLFSTKNAIDAFLNQVNQLKSLKNHHIKPYKYIIQTEKTIFFIRDYIAAQPISTVSPNSLENQNLGIWRQLLDVFEEIHSKRLGPFYIHPNNIYVYQENNVVLADLFPLSLGVDISIHPPNVFDIGFLPPEYFTDQTHLTMHADTWSLGIILYFLLYKILPWSSKSFMGFLNEIDKFDLDRFDDLKTGKEYLIKFLQVNPELRPIKYTSFIKSIPNALRSVKTQRPISNHFSSQDENQINMSFTHLPQLKIGSFASSCTIRQRAPH